MKRPSRQRGRPQRTAQELRQARELAKQRQALLRWLGAAGFVCLAVLIIWALSAQLVDTESEQTGVVRADDLDEQECEDLRLTAQALYDYCRYKRMGVDDDRPTHPGLDDALRNFKQARERALSACSAASGLFSEVVEKDLREVRWRIDRYRSELDVAITLATRAHEHVQLPIRSVTRSETENMATEMNDLAAALRTDRAQQRPPTYGHDSAIQKSIRCIRFLRILRGERRALVRAALWASANTQAVQARSQGAYAMRR